MKPFARRTILLLAWFILTASGFYCMVMGMLMIFASPSDEIKYQVYAMKTTSMPLYMSFAALYYIGAIHIIFPACGRRLISAGCQLWPSLSPTSYIHWSLVGETVQTVAQLLQAYRLSQRDVNLEVTTGYTVLVGFSIVLSPWFFLFPDPFVHQNLWHLFSSLLSFVLATGFYLVFFIPPLLALKFGDSRQVYSMLWTTKYTLLTRYIAPTSALDLSEKAILFFMSWVNVQRLVYTTNIQKGPRVVSIVPTPRARAISRVNIQRQSKSFLVLLGYNVILGLLVIIGGLYHAFTSPDCPEGCQLAIHPWFTSNCECAYFHLDCHSTPNFSTILTQDYLGSSLFFLHITECPLLQGFDLSYLSPFQSLFGLTIEFSNMTTWSKGDWPPSVMSIEVRYANLSTIPEALLNLPPHCKVLTIAQSLGISTLPTTVKDAWSTLSRLVLNNNRFSTIPEWIAELTTLERLVFSSNALEFIPEAALARLPVLTHLELAQNLISHFPSQLLTTSTVLEVLDLSNNLVQIVDADETHLLNGRKVLLDGNPVCQTAMVCTPTCSSTCSNLQVGDQVCHLNCFNPVCEWDLGDCANQGSQ